MPTRSFVNSWAIFQRYKELGTDQNIFSASPELLIPAWFTPHTIPAAARPGPQKT